jgi:hypothetical protein
MGSRGPLRKTLSRPVVVRIKARPSPRGQGFRRSLFRAVAASAPGGRWGTRGVDRDGGSEVGGRGVAGRGVDRRDFGEAPRLGREASAKKISTFIVRRQHSDGDCAQREMIFSGGDLPLFGLMNWQVKKIGVRQAGLL